MTTNYQTIHGKLIVRIESKDKAEVENEINRIVGFASARDQVADFIGPDLVGEIYVAIGNIA